MKTAKPIACPEESVLELRERSGKYSFLSRLLAVPPNTAVLEDIQLLEWMGQDWKPDLETLQVEFTRLFSVPGQEAIAAHQSVYTDVLRIESSGTDSLGCGMSFEGGEFRGYLGGESCAQLTHWYASSAFQPLNSSSVMADHIATELAFFAHLYLAEARACEAGEVEEAGAFQELHKEFYTQFLGRWVKTFGEKLAANTASEFYRRIGRHVLIEVCVLKAHYSLVRCMQGRRD